jgi:hypothetical protein
MRPRPGWWGPAAEQDAVQPDDGVPEARQQEDHEQVQAGERLGVQHFLQKRHVQSGELERQRGGDGCEQHRVGQGPGPGP